MLSRHPATKGRFRRRAVAPTRSLRCAAALVLVALALCACHKITVVRQAEPNPLTGAPHYAVVPLDFEAAVVDDATEREYLASEEPQSRESFGDDKLAMSDAFGRTLSGSEGLFISHDKQELDEFRLVPRVLSLEPGQWGGAQPASTRIEVTIETPEGQTLDVIEVEADSGEETSLGLVLDLVRNSQTGDRGRRMAIAAERAAQLVAEYLLDRHRAE